MDLLELLVEFAFELIGGLAEEGVIRYWRFLTVLALGLAVGASIAGRIPKRALGRIAAAPVVLTAAAIGWSWQRRF
jgi:hypothetical protein